MAKRWLPNTFNRIGSSCCEIAAGAFSLPPCSHPYFLIALTLIIYKTSSLFTQKQKRFQSSYDEFVKELRR